jgi:hypothetical protein
MPPRRSARVAAAEELRTCALAPLPLALAQRIFVSLPADSRARASCVCHGWWTVLADPALWTRLDLSKDSGVARTHNPDALLAGAAGRAHRQLRYLDVADVHKQLTPRVLLAVLAANAGSLRELRVGKLRATGDEEATLEALLGAAPLLQVLDAAAVCFGEEAPRLMRAEPPFAPLRLHSLNVFLGRRTQVGPGHIEEVGPFAALLADAALQPALSNVHIIHADTQQPVVLDSLVDAWMARRLRFLRLFCCTPPAAAPLARLLVQGALVGLVFANVNGDAPLFDTAGAALVATALRATTSLTMLYLQGAGLYRDMRAASTLLGALVGHPSLCVLSLDMEHAHDPVALGALLAALVAADAPALRALSCTDNALGDDGLAQIVDALPRNRHLHNLDISGNGMSERFARTRLLPAVRANTGLAQLFCGVGEDVGPAAKAAQDLVACRPGRQPLRG